MLVRFDGATLRGFLAVLPATLDSKDEATPVQRQEQIDAFDGAERLRTGTRLHNFQRCSEEGLRWCGSAVVISYASSLHR